MSQHNAAVVALHDRIAQCEADLFTARNKLHEYEQSVRHANNIIGTSQQVIAELRAAIAKLEAK